MSSGGRPAPGSASAGAPGPSGDAGADAAARPLEVVRPGRVGYREALRIQEERVGARRAGRVPDALFLLEHPDVITLGTGARTEHVLADPAELDARGIPVVEVGRGGDVTYHGPGQLVGYPILDLKPDRKDLHRYLRDLEEVLIRALAHFGIGARRAEGLTGVWVDGGKIAAIGVRVSSGWITSHGFALNVDPALERFEAIVPCGIVGRGVTSMARELGGTPERGEVEATVARTFARVFGRRLEAGEPADPRSSR